MEAVPDASDAEGSCSGSQVCLASGLLRFICCGHQAWLIRVQGLQAGAGILLPLEPLAWIPWCSGHPSCQGRQRQPWIPACARGDVAERVPCPCLLQRDHSQSPTAPSHSQAGKVCLGRSHSRPFLELAGHHPGGLEQFSNLS